MFSNAKYPLRTNKTSGISYTAIRFEGETGVSGTPGASSCIYECYLFANNVIEINFGNWSNSITGAIAGFYAANGTQLAAYSPVTLTSFVFVPNSTATSYTVNSSNSYVTGAIVTRQSLSAGNSPAGTWPPTDWTNISLPSNLDDSFVSASVQGNILFNNVSRDIAFIGSNMYINFGAGSIVYGSGTPLSSTNPPNDKIMMNSGDRSYQRVAYKYGSK